MKLMPKVRGFTLIELLITISIISILSAIGMVAYSSVMKQGRDSKRQSDLRSVQSALEQYYADQKFYPMCLQSSCVTYSVDSGLQFTSSIGINPASPTPSPIKTYMNSLPVEPANNSSNPYAYIGRNQNNPQQWCDNLPGLGHYYCISYCLYARLENPPSPIPAAPIGCAYTSGYNFAVGPP